MIDLARVGSNDAKRLLSIIERMERLAEETKALAADMSDLTALETAIIRNVLRLRKSTDGGKMTLELTEVYMRALGALADTPLGHAAIASATAEPVTPPRKKGRSALDDIAQEVNAALQEQVGTKH